MSEHHEYSPSKYPAWAECLGFASAERTSEDATAGTKAHDELSLMLKKGIESDNPTVRWGYEEIVKLAGSAFILIDSELMVNGTIPELKGIFGTTDVHWVDEDGTVHYGDFKTFSDGSVDYSMQLKGYAALNATPSDDRNTLVDLHTFHGGSRIVETLHTTLGECIDSVVDLLKRKSTSIERNLCHYCKFCKHAKECPQVNSAVDTVANNSLSFSNMSLLQKLVIVDAIEKIGENIRAEARKLAEESEDKAVEMDGIRYELKPWAGKPRLTDICQLAGSVLNPVVNTTNRKGESSDVEIRGITNEELLAMCDLPKSKVADALKKKNADNKAVKKSDIEKWVSSFYEKTEGTPRFTRVK